MTDVRDYLTHILTAIERIEQTTVALTVDDFLRNADARDIVERNLERISEASRHIPDEIKELYDLVPWQAVAGIGNVLRHDYDDIDPRIIWQTATVDVPIVKRAICDMLAR